MQAGSRRYPEPPFPRQHQVKPGENALDLADVPGALLQGSGKLRDKIAIITGADSGIGRSVAVLFAREGADVAAPISTNMPMPQSPNRRSRRKAGAAC